MTSVCPQRVRFRNCLTIQSGTRSFSREEQTLAWGVCVSSSPLAPPSPVAVGGRAPGGEGCAAPRPRVNGSRAFWKKLVLVPNTFPTELRPLNQQPLSSPAARAGTVELRQLSKTKGAFSSPGWRRGRPFSHLLQFRNQTKPNQTHPPQPREERPTGETRGARLVSPPLPGQAACAQQGDQITFLGSATPTRDE